LRADIDKVKKKVKTAKLPNPDGSTEKKDLTYDEMDRRPAGKRKRRACCSSASIC
jgi:hypothetical protein